MNSELNFDDVMNRLKECTKAKSFNALAEILGLSSSNFANLKKRNSVPYDKILEFSKSHNVSMDWILTGEGEMLKKTAKNLAAVNDETGERNRWLISMFNKLAPEDQDDAVKEIKKIAENREIRRELMQVRQEVRQLARSAA